MLAITAAACRAKSFADVLVLVFKLFQDLEGYDPRGAGKPSRPSSRKDKRKNARSKHDPRGNGGDLVSEEAFAEARKRMPPDFWLWLLLILGRRFQAQHAKYVQWNEFRLLALDGTEIALQRDARLAAHFGTSRNGKRRRTPQARMLMLAFPLARVPYRYELAPRSCHEQKMAARMLGSDRAAARCPRIARSPRTARRARSAGSPRQIHHPLGCDLANAANGNIRLRIAHRL